MQLLTHLRRVVTAASVALLVLIHLLLSASEGVTTPRVQEPEVTGDVTTGQIELGMPKYFAVFLHLPDKLRRLYTTGDVMFHPRDPVRAVIIDRASGEGILLRESPSGHTWSLRKGSRVPGFPEWIFTGTVLLDELEYQFRVVEGIPREDARLLSIAGSKAVLEKEVLQLPSDALKAGTRNTGPLVSRDREDLSDLAALLPVRKVDDDTYEVSEAFARPAIEQAGEMLSKATPQFTPFYSRATGGRSDFRSMAGDGTFGQGGFTVTRMKVAQTFGLEVGDTILSLNGRPVKSPVGAWWTYQELFVKHRKLTDVRLELIREGKLRTKTFRIR